MSGGRDTPGLRRPRKEKLQLGQLPSLVSAELGNPAPWTSDVRGVFRRPSAIGPACHVTRGPAPGWLPPGYQWETSGPASWPSPAPAPPSGLEGWAERGTGGTGRRRRRRRTRLLSGAATPRLPAADGSPRSRGCGRAGARRRRGSCSGTPPSPPRTPRSSATCLRRWPSSARTSRGGGPRWDLAGAVGAVSGFRERSSQGAGRDGAGGQGSSERRIRCCSQKWTPGPLFLTSFLPPPRTSRTPRYPEDTRLGRGHHLRELQSRRRLGAQREAF